MRLLRKFLALSAMERRLLVEATLLVAVIQLGLGRLPFTMLRRVVTRVRGNGRRPVVGPRVFADQVVWAVTAASHRVPGPTTCLSRALAVQVLLARGGYPSRLHVGVVRGKQGEVDGHAWVECEGRILIGGSASEIGEFTPLAVFEVENTAPNLQPVATLQEGR
jgi:hypothetical protein